jgi:hypothetical protein
MKQEVRRGRAAINRIAKQWMANRGAMDSNLVRPAGDWLRL